MSPQLGNVGLESNFGKQGSDFFTQPAGWLIFFNRRAPKNIPYFLFHAAAVPRRATLQPSFNSILDVADDKLGHFAHPQRYNDIMISHENNRCMRRFQAALGLPGIRGERPPRDGQGPSYAST